MTEVVDAPLAGWAAEATVPAGLGPRTLTTGRRAAELAGRTRPRTRWTDVLTAVHGSSHVRVAGIADGAVVLLAAEMLRVVPIWVRLAAPLAFVAVAYLCQVYAPRDTVQTRGFLWYPLRIVVPLTVFGLGARATGAVTLGTATALCLTVMALLTLLRAGTWSVLTVARRHGHGLRHALIIGDGETATVLRDRLLEFPEAGLLPRRILSYAEAKKSGTLDREMSADRIRHVLLVAPGPGEALLTAALPRHSVAAPYFSTVPSLAELFLDPQSSVEVGGIPLVPLGRVTRARHTFPGKRVLDLVAGGALALALLPVIAVVALAIKLDDGGPVFYRQTRVGRGGESFGMLKFRSMVVGADAMLADLAEDNMTDGLLFKMRNDPRITRVGRFLRRTSLDELPQVWNVLRGTMSLVGPRPLPVDAAEFSPGDAERHTVLPGITGYWQLSGGPELTYQEMIRLDLAYIRSWSLWLDLRLLVRTVPAMLHRHGAG
ncbi:MAG TPA: sugar transferase [Mycobacteriales bacterium]